MRIVGLVVAMELIVDIGLPRMKGRDMVEVKDALRM